MYLIARALLRKEVIWAVKHVKSLSALKHFDLPLINLRVSWSRA